MAGCTDCNNDTGEGYLSLTALLLKVERMICMLADVSKKIDYATANCSGSGSGTGGGTPGRVDMRSFNGYIQYKNASDSEWINIIPLSEITGNDGRTPELRNNGTEIQWKYTDATNWTLLVAVASLKGENGKNPEYRNSGGYIQWRLVGDTTWINLVALADISGTNGKNTEMRTNAGFIQWRVVGDATWLNLLPLDDIKGTNGTNGVNPELRTLSTMLQWKLVNSATWIDLFDLSTLGGSGGATPTDIDAYLGVEAVQTIAQVRALVSGSTLKFVRLSDKPTYFAAYIPGDTDSPDDGTRVLVQVSNNKRWAVKSFYDVTAAPFGL